MAFRRRLFLGHDTFGKNESVYNRHIFAKKNFHPINTNSYYILDKYNVSYKNESLNESHVKNCQSDNIFAWSTIYSRLGR